MTRFALVTVSEAAELTSWTTMAHELAEMHYGAAIHSLTPGDIMKSLDVWKDLAHTMFNVKEFIYVR